MRISITIPTAAVCQPPSNAPPLVQLGAKGELLLLELQGELGYEGDPRGRVVGILDFERMVSSPVAHEFFIESWIRAEANVRSA